MKPAHPFVALLLAATLRPAAPEPVQADDGAASITVQDLRAHVEFLASDELQGREAGTEFNDIAGRYVASQFERIGLAQVCEGGKSWFQPFTFGKRSSRNVVGLLRGTDPKLADEVVVIGAHYDHVGLGRFGSTGGITEDDKIHNGADDNASGTAGIIELAEAFAKKPTARTLLFIAFSAEELGLLGSKAYVDEPVVPLEKTVAMINLDMIGRSKDDYLFVGGLGTSDAWEGLIEKHVKGAGFDLETHPGGNAPSDNANFYRKRIPVLFFFTNIHDNYHRPSDHADKIEYEAQAKILRAAHALLRDLAAGPAPVFRKSDGMAVPKDFMQRMMDLQRQPAAAKAMGKQVREAAKERAKETAADVAKETESPAKKPMLGVSVGGGAGGAVTIERVAAGGNAEKAGLQVGDEVVAIDGKPVKDYTGVSAGLADKKVGDEVVVRIKRGGAESDVKVPLR